MSAEIVEDALNEVLDIVQRQKRAQITRANKKKLEVARRVAQGRMASQKNLKKRAYAQARKIVRRKFAGKRGEEYDSLGPAEKVQIDKAVAGKLKVIKKIAARLLPRIQQAEAKRLSSFIKGKQLQNLGAKESGPMNEETNKKFGDKFKGKKEQKKVASQIKMYNKFSEEAASGSGAYKALNKKAAASGIDIEILGEVFDRGLKSWNEDVKVSRQQYAFARVNSYINQGKSYFNEDADLHEEHNEAHKELSALKKHLDFVHVGLPHFYDKEHAELEPKAGHNLKTPKDKINHIHKALKKAGYTQHGTSRVSDHGTHTSYWSSHENNEVHVHVPKEEHPKKYGVTAVHYINYKHDHGHKPDVHANLSDAGHENGQKIYNRELGHHAIKESINEGINKPYVKKTKGLSGQDSWKAMNKHGKTKWFNNPDSAHTHAGINKPVNENLDESLEQIKKLHPVGSTRKVKVKHLSYHGKYQQDHNKDLKMKVVAHHKDKQGRKYVEVKPHPDETYHFNNPNATAWIKHEHIKEEYLDELSAPLMHSYLDKAKKTTPMYPPRGTSKEGKAKIAQRNANMKLATKKISRKYQAEELGPENDIGTDALVRKVRKVTPGQENAQTHENCGTDACCQNCPTAVKEAASVITNTADTKRVKAKTPDGKIIWRNVRASRDIIKD